MKWDKTVNIILFFIFLDFLSVVFYEPIFLYQEYAERVVSGSQGLFSLCILALWISLIVYSSLKRHRHFLIGGCVYWLLLYLPERILPLLNTSSSNPDLITGLLQSMLKFSYVLAYAPLSGLIAFFSLETVQSLIRRIPFFFILIYFGMQIVRYYRNAYISYRLQMGGGFQEKMQNKKPQDLKPYTNPDLAKILGSHTPPENRIPRTELSGQGKQVSNTVKKEDTI